MSVSCYPFWHRRYGIGYSIYFDMAGLEPASLLPPVRQIGELDDWELV